MAKLDRLIQRDLLMIDHTAMKVETEQMSLIFLLDLFRLVCIDFERECEFRPEEDLVHAVSE